MCLRFIVFVSTLTYAASLKNDTGNENSLLSMVLHCSQRWSASQESCPEACRLWPEYCYYAVAAELGVPGTCKLPPYPRVGSYNIENIARADGALADFSLFYSCPQAYILLGQQPQCQGGVWTAAFPVCQSETKCQLKEDPSLTYKCIDYAGAGGKCPEWVGSGDRVQPECRPDYEEEQLGLMHCVSGNWNFVPTCQQRGEPGDELTEPNHLRMVSRMEWLATRPLDKLRLPAPWVIIWHTATDFCYNQSTCVYYVRLVQEFHMGARGWNDIGFNFLVGGDGSAYYGRGWDYVGAHTLGYNKYSIGIGFIGNFTDEAPPQNQLDACKTLIKIGVDSGKIAKDYKLFVRNQLAMGNNLGKKFVEVLQEWPHYVKDTSQMDELVPKY